MDAKMKEYSFSQEEVVTEGKTNTQVVEIRDRERRCGYCVYSTGCGDLEVSV